MKPEDIPKFELDTSKIEEFGISLIVAFIVSVALALVVNPESWDAIFFGLMNTVSASYPLIYWILLKEKKKNS